MTAEDLAHTLRRLAGHLNHLQDHIYDTPLHATRYSQTDSHQSHGGPKSPTNDTDLDYLNEVQGRLGEMVKNVSEDLGILIPRNVVTGNFWAAWLYRNRNKLPQLGWYEDLVDNLTDIETELRVKIHPQDPNPQIEHRQTARSICHRLDRMGHHIRPATLRQWAQRGKITAIEQADGKNGYLLSEVINQI